MELISQNGLMTRGRGNNKNQSKNVWLSLLTPGGDRCAALCVTGLGADAFLFVGAKNQKSRAIILTSYANCRVSISHSGPVSTAANSSLLELN